MAARKSRQAGARRTGKGAKRAAAPKRAAGRAAAPKQAGRARGKRTAAPTRKLGYAVIGLGHIAQVAVLPAFKHARNAKLVALVSGEAKKRDELARKYRVKHAFDYADLDACLALDEVEAVYIALPNDQHREYAERAARAGVHVLCEKPMALSSDDCGAMISAARDGDVRLMIAYRLHFEPVNLAAIEVAQSGKLGDLKFFTSEFSFQVSEDNIRTMEEHGGGPIWDIGTYCINAARYLFRSEPTEVYATATRNTADPRFSEVDDTTSVLLRFPDQRLASFTVSFGTAATASYRLVGTKGDLRVDQAYEYQGPRRLTVTIDDKPRERRFAPSDQFAPELDALAACVFDGREPEPSGIEGLADVRVIEAVLESIRAGRPVTLEPLHKPTRPGPEQRSTRPPVEEPKLVDAEAPYQ